MRRVNARRHGPSRFASEPADPDDDEVPLLDTLPLIAAYDQLAAALDQLRSQITCCLDLLPLSSDERVRLAQVCHGLEAVIISVDELLAFKRSEER
jgi:hypothetical protein